jgi:2-haloacid dehalogenase
MTAPLTVGACVFDAYGTLFDYASAAARCQDVLGEHTQRLTALWREKQLQYTWLRALEGHHVSFEQVTADALDFSLAALGLESPALRNRLLDLYRALECFPEVPAMLARLRASGMRCAILSNGSPEMLAAALAHTGLGGFFELVLSVEEVQVYKPHPRVYRLAVERLGLPAQAISFQSANGWDVYAASAFGLRTVWCNRNAHVPERLPGSPDFVIRSLTELPRLLGLSLQPH